MKSVSKEKGVSQRIVSATFNTMQLPDGKPLHSSYIQFHTDIFVHKSMGINSPTI